MTAPQHPCIILDLRCLNCGPVRMVVAPEQPPPSTCPYCTSEAIARKLGTGITRTPLPYFELAPNVAVLDSVMAFSQNSRFVSSGHTVCFSADVETVNFAKVLDVYTSLPHMAGGRPSVSFIVRGKDIGPVPHVSGADTRPWWCWPDELPNGGANFAVMTVQGKKLKERMKA